MIDREKVIKGLEICTSKPCYCTDCPYKSNCYLDSQEVMEDALSLLKEQEPVSPIAKKEMDECTSCLETIYCCGNCGAYLPLYKEYNIFCVKCGRKVKWDG